MDNQLNFLYAREADVLYVSRGHPEYTDYQELDENLILRLDPKSKEIVGFTIIDFAGRFSRTDAAVNVPLKVTFERPRRTGKIKIAAERKPAYHPKSAATHSRRRVD
ncbi:MAG: DUF2283 domain-containing protein [Chloroflexi bacterium]|nr:DUF2283 domain-containing protein [Chloroflexota bacterium]